MTGCADGVQHHVRSMCPTLPCTARITLRPPGSSEAVTVAYIVTRGWAGHYYAGEQSNQTLSRIHHLPLDTDR